MGARFRARALLVAGLLYLPAAHAYLDPGTGSVILQVLLGGLAGLAVAIKLFWHRLTLLFVPWRRREEPKAPREPAPEAEDSKRPS